MAEKPKPHPKADTSMSLGYTVKDGVIRDSSGTVVSRASVANDAARAAKDAKDNMSAVGGFPDVVKLANSKLHGDAHSAAEAIRLSIEQEKKLKPKPPTDEIELMRHTLKNMPKK